MTDESAISVHVACVKDYININFYRQTAVHWIGKDYSGERIIILLLYNNHEIICNDATIILATAAINLLLAATA